MTPYASLFSSIELAGRRLRNRIVHPSMTTVTGADGRATDRLIQYHLNRARGGAAMLITEPLAVAPHQKVATRVRAWNAHAEESLTRWAKAVEAEDCRLIAQIQDAGRGRHAPGRNYEAIGASALPDDISWTMPHVLSLDEISTLLGHFVESAARVKRCGFSGVEISAGHGHLFHQFMSAYSNTRTDAYGGVFENRMRLVLELIKLVRERCGTDFILGIKLPSNDGIEGSIDHAAAAKIATCVTQTGLVDYVCFAQGAHARTLELHIPDGHKERNPYAETLNALKASVGKVPVMALGRINDPAQADAIVEQGEAELVGIGRALITDAAWSRKAQLGQASRIRYCVGGNTCWKTIVGHMPIACDNNPRVAMPDELDEVFTPAAIKKRVVVVGSGIAGLEAAWIAAARGHHVTLIARGAEVGGKVRQLVSLPGGEDLSSIYDYQYVEGVRVGVNYQLNQEATLETIAQYQPEVVVLATGSTMIWPRMLPQTLRQEGWIPDLRRAMNELDGVTQHQSGTAVILDMDHTEGTYAAAERLHTLFDRVVVMTPRATIADEVALVTRQGIYRRFHEKGIDVLYAVEPRWTDTFENEATLQYVSIYGGVLRDIENVAFFAYSTPRQPNDDLALPLKASGLEVHLIGDCRAARNILAATTEGDAVGRAL